MNQTQPNWIDEIAGGYRAAQVLLTANRLNLFEIIGDNAETLDRILESIQADRRGMRILCDALVAIGILVKENERYRLVDAVKDHLLPGKPSSMNAMLHHAAKLYETWGKLYDSVVTGKQVPDEAIDPRLLGDEKRFAQAMADIGRRSAAQTADLIDLSGVTTLLDVGGGPGLYSIEFAKRYPVLTVTLFDNEKTLEVARTNAAAAGLLDRVRFQPGDALSDPFEPGFDFIFLSNFVHIFSYSQNRDLVKKCAQALAPGGRIAIKDFFLDPGRVSPQWSALFAVNMLVNTEGGDCYTVAEVTEWFDFAGLFFESIKDMTPQSRIVLGKKP